MPLGPAGTSRPYCPCPASCVGPRLTRGLAPALAFAPWLWAPVTFPVPAPLAASRHCDGAAGGHPWPAALPWPAPAALLPPAPTSPGSPHCCWTWPDRRWAGGQDKNSFPPEKIFQGQRDSAGWHGSRRRC